jgi:hypothetical protein
MFEKKSLAMIFLIPSGIHGVRIFRVWVMYGEKMREEGEETYGMDIVVGGRIF